MSFTTPCSIIVKNKEQAISLMQKIKEIGERKIYEIQNNISYPCICGVSTNIISLCDVDELSSAGFIDCGTNEPLFLAIAGRRDGTDYMQWFIDRENKWLQCQRKTIREFIDIAAIHGYEVSDLRKATVPELIEHFKTEL